MGSRLVICEGTKGNSGWEGKIVLSRSLCCGTAGIIDLREQIRLYCEHSMAAYPVSLYLFLLKGCNCVKYWILFCKSSFFLEPVLWLSFLTC